MKIVIIGNGISGTNAARFIRKKSDCEIHMISSESEFPFSRTALMYIYMGHMKFEHTKLYDDHFWTKNKINRVFDHADRIDFTKKTIHLSSGKSLHYDKLIIATGSKSNYLACPGQNLKGVQGMYSLQDLNAIVEKSKQGIRNAVIIGGGLIGIELAEMFHSRNISVSFLVRENSFWNNILPKQESAMVNHHILSHGIDLRLGQELNSIHGNEKVEYIITKHGEKIDCDFVGLTIGVTPNIDFIKNTEIKTNRGILINEFLETNIEGVYAIGDCAELVLPQSGRKHIEAIWYTGRMMGQTVASNVLGDIKKYNPGIWFNSAKFFDIEYQVYGYVPIKDDQTSQLYWEHNERPCSIRIVFDSTSQKVLGFNLMGIRYRHEVCEKWIQNQTSIEEVLENLSLANFDPEFFQEYELELISIYNQKFNKKLTAKSTRNLNLVHRFLKVMKN